MIDKLRRMLESLQNREVDQLGYEARIRHQQKIDELQQRYQEALAELAAESEESPAPQTVAPTI